ncbi:hypothetical protein [Amycolatopsis jiangsuensis]|uniref:Uncharacterized protein n=1 Tax=Amycolatopsis jiangsuensis TaxID=1181879 RepID=A0A840IRL1_9PSEU|nr:hypothetical protein [Amycolatopsis jiangsuensis]MBB4684473.1 hypothetical protein [Amycolatopsis jiangsuensis]
MPGSAQPDPATVAAAGKVTEALETVERARGHLYAFHQLTGYADLTLDDAVELLRKAGHDEWADRVATELIGINVVQDRWTYQVVEEYDDGYYRTFTTVENEVRAALTGGRRHLVEENEKRRRRTPGRPGHEQGAPTTAPSGEADSRYMPEAQ